MTSDLSFLSVLDVDFTRRTADKLEEALKKKDQDLAEAQKEALNKMKLAEEKLASVGTLEKENSRLTSRLAVSRAVFSLEFSCSRVPTEASFSSASFVLLEASFCASARSCPFLMLTSLDVL